MKIRQAHAGHAVAERGWVEPFAVASVTGVVRAIAREQHAHVHLVRLGLEPLEPADHAGEKTLFPTAVPLQHELLVHGRQRAPRFVCRDAMTTTQLGELGALPLGRRPAPRTNRALVETTRIVRDDLLQIYAERAPKAATR